MFTKFFEFIDVQQKWESRYAAAAGPIKKLACFAGYYLDLYRLKERPTLFQRSLRYVARPLAQLGGW